MLYPDPNYTNIPEKEKNNIDINIYPNPAKDKINIVGKNIKKVEIVNLNGQIVKSRTINSENYIIDVSDLSKGLYFIKINNGREVKKIVVK
jgi:hypothetical protein